jgi:hypothetical protein
MTKMKSTLENTGQIVRNPSGKQFSDILTANDVVGLTRKHIFWSDWVDFTIIRVAHFQKNNFFLGLSPWRPGCFSWTVSFEQP